MSITDYEPLLITASITSQFTAWTIEGNILSVILGRLNGFAFFQSGLAKAVDECDPIKHIPKQRFAILLNDTGNRLEFRIERSRG